VFTASKDLDRSASDCVWSVGQVSKDAGRTWTTVYVGGQRDRPPSSPVYGWACITDPIMAFNKDGVLVYALQAYNYQTGGSNPPPPLGSLLTAGSAFYFARSRDGGATFDRIIPVHVGDGNVAFHDYPRMAANPRTGSVYAVWNQVGLAGSVVVVVTTRDGGETAAAPVYVTTPHDRTGAFQSGIAATRDGTVFLMLGGFFTDGINHLTRSTDDAATFEEPWRIFDVKPIPGRLQNTRFRTGTAVELAVDASGGARDGWLYAAWPDLRLGDPDILFSRSMDGGRTWTPPVRIHEAHANDQFMPRLTVGPDGAVHVLYYTRAYDANNTRLDAEYAYSEDGGDTWTSQRVTQHSFDGDLGLHQDGFPFIGDYLGIAAAGDHVYLGFSTTITGRAETAVARLDRRADA
jgi:hypothetical protein